MGNITGGIVGIILGILCIVLSKKVNFEKGIRSHFAFSRGEHLEVWLIRFGSALLIFGLLALILKFIS